MLFTFQQAASIVMPTSEWHGHGLEELLFDIHACSLDEALALRSCWVPCLTFGSYTTDPRWREAEAGSNANLAAIEGWAEPFDPARPINIMTCSKALLERLRPGRCCGDFPDGDHITFDGNHRLTKLSLRRSQGHRDDVTIKVYACTTSA